MPHIRSTEPLHYIALISVKMPAIRDQLRLQPAWFAMLTAHYL